MVKMYGLKISVLKRFEKNDKNLFVSPDIIGFDFITIGYIRKMMLWLHTAVGDANAEKPTLKNTNIGLKNEKSLSNRCLFMLFCLFNKR
jgi:hypothetical protein